MNRSLALEHPEPNQLDRIDSKNATRREEYAKPLDKLGPRARMAALVLRSHRKEELGEIAVIRRRAPRLCWRGALARPHAVAPGAGRGTAAMAAGWSRAVFFFVRVLSLEHPCVVEDDLEFRTNEVARVSPSRGQGTTKR